MQVEKMACEDKSNEKILKASYCNKILSTLIPT